MPALVPDVDLDTSILEELDFDENIECDAEGCSRDAVYTIRCVCRKGVEFSCKPCVDSMLSSFLAVIKFDEHKSCGHSTLIALCTIAPL